MTEQQWAAFASELETAFKGDLDPTTERVYAAHLADLDYDVGRAGLALLVQRGQVFLPLPGEVVGAARAVVVEPDPPWCEAWPAIRRALFRCHPDAQAVAAEVEREAGPAAAAFVRVYGARRLWLEPVADPDVGGAVVARLGREYEDHRAHATERTRRGAAIEAAERDALAAGRDGLRRLLSAAPALTGGAA